MANALYGPLINEKNALIECEKHWTNTEVSWIPPKQLLISKNFVAIWTGEQSSNQKINTLSLHKLQLSNPLSLAARSCVQAKDSFIWNMWLSQIEKKQQKWYWRRVRFAHLILLMKKELQVGSALCWNKIVLKLQMYCCRLLLRFRHDAFNECAQEENTEGFIMPVLNCSKRKYTTKLCAMSSRLGLIFSHCMGKPLLSNQRLESALPKLAINLQFHKQRSIYGLHLYPNSKKIMQSPKNGLDPNKFWNLFK